MTMVRFATTCDAMGCGKRSDEYTAWPNCVVCNDDFCNQHCIVDPTNDDGEHSPRGVCHKCAELDDLDDVAENILNHAEAHNCDCRCEECVTVCELFVLCNNPRACRVMPTGHVCDSCAAFNAARSSAVA